MTAVCVAGDGVTIKVGVHYESRSPRRIALKFQEAGVSDVHITPLTETLIAPALLPRGWVQQRILLALKEVSTLSTCSASVISIQLHMVNAKDIAGQVSDVTK